MIRSLLPAFVLTVAHERGIFKIVRYLLTGRLPAVESILLVESGSRGLIEKVAPGLRENWGPETAIDLVTCYSGIPQGIDPESARVYRVMDYRGRPGRRKLYRELRANRYGLVGIVCSGEPIMAKWKWALAWRIPAKVFVINENGDYFWLDRLHLDPIRQTMMLRAGLAGAGAVRTLARLFSFPFTVTYLLLYAAAIHTRRVFRRG